MLKSLNKHTQIFDQVFLADIYETEKLGARILKAVLPIPVVIYQSFLQGVTTMIEALWCPNFSWICIKLGSILMLFSQSIGTAPSTSFGWSSC